MNELALFAGSGGGILGSHLLKWRTVCAVEFNAYRARRLMQRQNEGHLPPFPIWDDVRTFDGRPWRGTVDVVSAGFPCQDISVIGGGAGIDGEFSGLWTETARIIREVRPRKAWLENSPALTSRGLDRVLGDLAEMGFDATWGVLGASFVGADHQRDRIWIAADAVEERQQGWHSILEKRRQIEARGMEALRARCAWAHIPAPDSFGIANGLAGRVERLQAIGDGQVPAVVAVAWRVIGGN